VASADNQTRLTMDLLLESSGSQAQLRCEWHFRVLEKIFLLSMIGVQQYAVLSLVVLGRLACGCTKLANLLQEGILSLLAFLCAMKEACRHSCIAPVKVGIMNS
jgi:hypothetical protein